MKAFKMAQPTTLDGAFTVCRGDFDKVKILAGGTDLLGALKDRIQTPDTVVNLKAIPGMKGVRSSEEGLVIGALTTLAELEQSPEVANGWPALVTTTRKTATPQIRNVATVGGNICQRPRCWYFRHELYHCLKKGGSICYAKDGENEYHAIFDNDVCNIIHPSNLAPVLIAYGAKIEVASAGKTELLDLEDFFVSPEKDVTVENVLAANQVVTRILLPRGTENRNAAYVEAREKSSYDWATCGATVNLKVSGDVVESARIVLSAVAPTPVRRRDLEGMVQGQKATPRLIDALCEAATKDAQPLRDNRYKTILVQTTLRRAFNQALKG